jgi:quercetin dioxygenase-like cupin family protein
MTRVRVASFTISLDGYGAGPNQDINNPLGIGGTDLHQWLFPTRTLQRTLFGKDGGTTGVDDDFAARGFENVGAWILGRNMFSPLRGPWPDMNWKGWWGDNPPYHVPVFIMTHHARPPIEMEGDTTFHSDHVIQGRVDIAPGAVIPDHGHPREQWTLLLSGSFELTVSGIKHLLRPGQVLYIAPHERHSARALTACAVLDVFHPPRDDYR